MLTLFLTVILVLAIVGFVTWLVVTYIPMPEPLPKVIVAVAVVLVLVWLIAVIVPRVSPWLN